MRFELKESKAKLLDVNPRPELHGEATKPAADLKLKVMLPSSELAQFHPTLRSFLYEKAAAPDLADQGTDDPTSLRFPQMVVPLKWDGEVVGGTITIHHGISPKSDLVLRGCMVNEFRIEPMEGGTVGLTFRGQCHPDEKGFGRLCSITGTDVVITVEPPEETQESLPGKE